MSLPAFIEAMLRVEFYPHRPREVTLVQSHISYVLLAGNEVYKVKKPVRFSFLDFSTLEQRRHFCHEEVRLNRRLAPDAYRGVVAICFHHGGYRLADDSDAGAVEYAVHMRRLPDDRMLDRLLERDAVTGEMIDAVVARLVAFHRAADCGAEVAANGDPAAIWRVLEENYDGVRPFRDVTIASGDDVAIQSFAREFMARHDALFRRRQAEQRIRDCHGDLHSEHLCFADDGLVIYDCIEFNQRLRYCDVASEIAFLAMDLEYHDRPELAAQLVASYAAHATDPDLPRLAPFYQCYRAYVRGKVDSLKSVEAEVSEADRAAAGASAQQHFSLAYRYTWVEHACVVAICGLSGSGKSTIAAALRARTGFVHVNSDVVRKELAGIAATGRRSAAYDEGIYAAEHSAATYRTMIERARAALAAGQGVIIDATFQRRRDRDELRALAADLLVPVHFVECQCSEEETRRRLDARGVNTPSDADWNVYVEQRRRFEAFAAEEGRITVDASTALPDILGVIESKLRAAAGSA